MGYIPAKNLPYLKEYKYSAVDLSPVSKYILQPYWSRLVLLFPLSTAPNLITLLGFICIISNTLTLIYFSPDLQTECPKWVYFTFAVGLFVYQSFDAIDGKQARRTGTSSPLGQLFDHGCDALNTSVRSIFPLGVVLGASALNLGSGWLTVLSFVASLANFYLTTWEEYHTGTLYLGQFNGPTEGILALVGVYLISGFKGYLIKGASWWSQPVSSSWPIPLNELTVYGVSAMMFPVLITSFINVNKVCKEKKKSFIVTLFGVLPFVFFVSSIYAWLNASPNIRQNHILVFILFGGAAFGNIVGKMIVSHVVHAEFPYFNLNFTLLFFGALNSNLPAFGVKRLLTKEQEVFYVYGCFVTSFLIHSHFVSNVIDQICNYLDINCLTIKKDKKNK